MASQLTLNTLKAAADRYDAAATVAQANWDWSCGCLSPGEKLECLDCVGFKLWITAIQQQLQPEPTRELPRILPPKLTLPYLDAVKQDCIQLYSKGYNTEQIRDLTGMNNHYVLMQWLREVGLIKNSTKAYERQKQRCIELSLEGLLPVKVQIETGVPADIVSRWLRQVDIQRQRRQFSEEDKQGCIQLYLSGKSFVTIAAEMDLPKSTVESWIRCAKVHRPRLQGGGRRSVHSDAFKQECVELMRAGKTGVEAAKILGVSRSTVRYWWRKSESK